MRVFEEFDDPFQRHPRPAFDPLEALRSEIRWRERLKEDRLAEIAEMKDHVRKVNRVIEQDEELIGRLTTEMADIEAYITRISAPTRP